METNVVQGVLFYSDDRPVADESVSFKTEFTDHSSNQESRTVTDSEGRFSLRILRGRSGLVRGEMYVYESKFKDCPEVDKLIEGNKSNLGLVEVKTDPVVVVVDRDLVGIRLFFPFGYCAVDERTH